MGGAERVALVTGAARGLGRATARAFLAAGLRVAVNDRDRASVGHAVAELGGPPAVTGAPGDIASVAGCRAAVGAAVAAFGRLDVVVNNAAINEERPVEDWDEALWDGHMDVILKGAYFCTQAALPSLRAVNGCVVNVASELGLLGVRHNAGYCAAKGGVVNLTRALAVELAPGVRVNCVCPGAIDTELMRACAAASGDVEAYYRFYAGYAPLGRIAQPDEIAAAIVYLASPAAAFVTGAVFAADGGSTAGRRTVAP
ncbi:MAG: SDR family NAD(P)-dependent oxidoreductase [Alphaproteobacteria bacterium]